MSQTLLSVGIDVGTSTTQLVFSRLTVKNEADAFSVPQFAISEKEILYRSRIHFTPLLSADRIDARGVEKIVEEEYRLANVKKESVQTGAVIITGETARKENAAEVLSALSGFAGDFVVATAGPALESILAGKGSGAATYSKEHSCSVLNLDIGGGTTNMALFENGKLCDTGCLNIGGRLMKFDAHGRCVYLSDVLKPFFTLDSDPHEVAQFLSDCLEEAVGLRKGETYRAFITDKLCQSAPLLSFSGGVAELIHDEAMEDFAYGDLGVLLGRAIFHSALCKGPYLKAKETIRATVIGAGSHTTELSGSTIFYDHAQFPLKNLPVVVLSEAEENTSSTELCESILRHLALFPDSPAVIALNGKRNPDFKELCKLAEGISLALQKDLRSPCVICVAQDIGKALGQAITMQLGACPLICLDGLTLHDGAYLDIGRPIADGQVLPVVIKTLIL
ncbi:MAG: ethanolamine ammonia-lyase [Ruminococcaceae bacterium]|nr:ethanolamine ammonia-lyase [Oscillospiraceae bacterium]